MAKIGKYVKVEIHRPFCGWAGIEIDDGEDRFYGCLSYIDDVPWVFLKAFRIYLETNQSVALEFDEEGTGFTLVIQYSRLLIIREARKIEYHSIYISAEDFIRLVVRELLANLDAWAEWEFVGGETTDQYREEYMSLYNECRSIYIKCLDKNQEELNELGKKY